jgi:hypothetical protein
VETLPYFNEGVIGARRYFRTEKRLWRVHRFLAPLWGPFLLAGGKCSDLWDLSKILLTPTPQFRYFLAVGRFCRILETKTCSLVARQDCKRTLSLPCIYYTHDASLGSSWRVEFTASLGSCTQAGINEYRPIFITRNCCERSVY